MDEHGRALAAGVALLERAIDYTLGSLRAVTPSALCRATPCAGWNLQRLLDHMTDSLQTLNQAATGPIPLFPIPTDPSHLYPPQQPLEGNIATHGRLTGPPPPGPLSPGPLSPGLPSSGPLPPGSPSPGHLPPGSSSPGSSSLGPSSFGPSAYGPSSFGLPSPAPTWVGNPALLVRDGATEVLGRWAAMAGDDLVPVGDRHLTSPMVAAIGAIELTAHGWDVAMACGEHRPIPPLLAEELLDLARLFVTAQDRPGRFAPPVPVPAHSPPQDHLLAHLGRHPDWVAHN
ncbi:hypothetical protein AB0M50_04435 [Nonomuraea fuscirosea]|uniref:hypothetical protein n=1 Tax=Nonomuraea fuscirosea TaxID=1291556 RepID=UPI003437A196